MENIAIVNLVLWVIIGILNMIIAVKQERSNTEDINDYKKYIKYWVITYTISYIMIILVLIQGVRYQ